MKQCKQIRRKNKHLRDLLCIKVNENNFVDSFFFPFYLLLFPWFFFLCVFLSSKPFQNNQMHCQIIDHYFNMFFVEMQVKKKLNKCFLGTRVWVPKPVYQSPKRPEYVTGRCPSDTVQKDETLLISPSSL